MLRRTLTAAFAIVLFWAPGALAGPFTKTDGFVTMSDGVQIATTFFEPAGPPPPEGWPAVALFHGLGQTRNSTELGNVSWNDVAETYLASQGYVVLTFDARAHGQSGGMFTLDGPRELQDTKELFAWVTSHPEVNAAKVGAFGVSYGGGMIWLSAVEGVPWAAIAVGATWTDLREALAPQGLGRSGIVLGFSNDIAPEKIPPDLQALLQDVLRQQNLDAVGAFLAPRSTRSRLSTITIPALILQGRRDFAFDADQAIAAFRAVRGPKRLYLGDFGHGPAKNPPAEYPYFATEVRQWFDHYLKGEANGADKRSPVELAPDPWSPHTVGFPALPPTRALRFLWGGAASLSAAGKVVRTTGRVPGVETFGGAVVRITATSGTGYRHLVVVLSALEPGGGETVVADGGAETDAIGAKPRTVEVRLQNEITPIPSGTRLRVTIGSTSTLQNPANLVYFNQVADGSRATISRVTLTLPVLAKTVSRTLATAHSTPGVTDTAVKIGGTVPLSGPAAAFGVVGPGAAAYFAWVNDHGGVNGRTIQYQYVDDGYDPTQTVQLTRQLVQQDQVLAIFNTIGTDNALAVQPLVNQLKVPELFAGTGASRAADPKRYPWTMPYLPSFAAEGAIYGRYVLRSMPKARIGVLQEDDDYGKNLLAGLSKALGARGAIVDIERYELTDTDVSAQVAKLKSAGANALMVFATPKFAIQAFIAASKLGWHPQFFVSSVSIEPTVMKIVSASTSPAFAEGALSIAFVKDPTNPRWARDPAVKLYRQIMAKYDPQGRPTDVYNFYGMTVAYTMVDVLKHAGRNLTRESLMRAAAHLAESDNPFLLPGIVLRTSPTDYYPIDQAALFRYHKGLWTQFGSLVRAVP